MRTNLDLNLEQPSVHLLLWGWDFQSHQPTGRVVLEFTVHSSDGAFQRALRAVGPKTPTPSHLEGDGRSCGLLRLSVRRLVDLTLLDGTTGIEHVQEADWSE